MLFSGVPAGLARPGEPRGWSQEQAGDGREDVAQLGRPAGVGGQVALTSSRSNVCFDIFAGRASVRKCTRLMTRTSGLDLRLAWGETSLKSLGHASVRARPVCWLLSLDPLPRYSCTGQTLSTLQRWPACLVLCRRHTCSRSSDRGSPTRSARRPRPRPSKPQLLLPSFACCPRTTILLDQRPSSPSRPSRPSRSRAASPVDCARRCVWLVASCLVGSR